MKQRTSTKDSHKILVISPFSYWADIGADLLRRVDLNCDIFIHKGWLDYIRWAISGRWRKYSVIYHVYGVWNWLLSLILAMSGKPIIWHWIGSDILELRTNSRGRIAGFIH